MVEKNCNTCKHKGNIRWVEAFDIGKYFCGVLKGYVDNLNDHCGYWENGKVCNTKKSPDNTCRNCRLWKDIGCSLLKDNCLCFDNDYRYWDKKKSDATYKSNLLKHFPNASIEQICRDDIYGDYGNCLDGDGKNCDECWNEEYCDEEKERETL